jgi:hypothetical protein
MLEGSYTKQFDVFWNDYFVKTWLHTYDPHTWNISTWLGNEDQGVASQLLNRTNNAVERFNRTMNETFPVAHPSVAQFVLAIRDLSQQYVNKMDNIRNVLKRKPKHKCATLHSIPDDYYKFVPSRSATSSTSTQLSRLHTVRGSLVNTIHKDDDDDVFYRVTDVTLQRIRNEDVLVAHRIEHPTAKRPKTGATLRTDAVSVQEICEYSNINIEEI